jgi:hypothetical protein
VTINPDDAHDQLRVAVLITAALDRAGADTHDPGAEVIRRRVGVYGEAESPGRVAQDMRLTVDRVVAIEAATVAMLRNDEHLIRRLLEDSTRVDQTTRHHPPGIRHQTASAQPSAA